jgi:hypothetical protein
MTALAASRLETARGRAAVAAALGVIAAAPAALWMWGFMVDDALIASRYAHHLARGLGYRFNPGGPATDGVTPLGWALVLAPFARGGVLAAFTAAKAMGLGAWLAGAALLGVAIDRLGAAGAPRSRWAALALVACSAPLAAWSVSGMETGVVLGLSAAAASASVLGRSLTAAACAGIVAGWRPECLPWATALALAPPATARPGPRRLAARLALALAPAALAAAVRLLVFGRALPLALHAKPSDWAHGWRYALACFLVGGPLALLAVRALPAWVRGMQLAVAAHLLAVALAGGDWMPLSRLLVPALPCVVLAAAWLTGHGPRPWAAGRLALGLLGPAHVMAGAAAGVGLALEVDARGGVRLGALRGRSPVREVGARREAVMRALAPALEDARAVATLDVGWVGAVAPGAVVDFAGVTDPAVAALEGGHTTKRLPPSLLAARGVDALVLLCAEGEPIGEPWTATRFARGVEARVAAMPAMAERFRPIAVSPGPLRYVVLRSQ